MTRKRALMLKRWRDFEARALVYAGDAVDGYEAMFNRFLFHARSEEVGGTLSAGNARMWTDLMAARRKPARIVGGARLDDAMATHGVRIGDIWIPHEQYRVVRGCRYEVTVEHEPPCVFALYEDEIVGIITSFDEPTCRELEQARKVAS